MQSVNLINGNIITLDEDNPNVSSLYIENGKIHSINQQVKNTQIIDLKGTKEIKPTSISRIVIGSETVRLFSGYTKFEL